MFIINSLKFGTNLLSFLALRHRMEVWSARFHVTKHSANYPGYHFTFKAEFDHTSIH